MVECPECRVVRETNPGEPGHREAEEHMVKSSGSNPRTQTAEPLSLQTRISLSAQSSGLIASMQQVTKVTSLAHAAASEDPTEGRTSGLLWGEPRSDTAGVAAGLEDGFFLPPPVCPQSLQQPLQQAPLSQRLRQKQKPWRGGSWRDCGRWVDGGGRERAERTLQFRSPPHPGCHRAGNEGLREHPRLSRMRGAV